MPLEALPVAVRARLDEMYAALMERRTVGTPEAVARRLSWLDEAARTGIEEREVEVSPRPNNDRLVVEFYRADTGDLVETRPMTEDEVRVARQQSLPLRDAKVVAIDASLRTGTSPVSPLRGNTKPPINPQG